MSQFAKAIQKNTTLKALELTVSHKMKQQCKWVEQTANCEEILKAIFASNLEHFKLVNFFEIATISLSDLFVIQKGQAFLKENYLPVSEAICQAMKGNSSLTKLTCPRILPGSFVELFFSSIPSQLKEITSVVIMCFCDA